jgi:amidophosphoribosyltransferase
METEHVWACHAGVDMPNRREFVAHNLDETQVCEVLGADGLLYQTVEDLLAAGKEINPEVHEFDASCFIGKYVTGDVDQEYLETLENMGRGMKRTKSGQKSEAPVATV